MKILIIAVIVITVAYGILALYAQAVKRTGMFFPERYPAGDWTPNLAIKPDDIFFTTPDGVRLHAWLFRAQKPNAPMMIFFHGNAGHLAYRGPVAAEIAARGISVFVFDYRGFGRSEGRPSEAALHLDSLAAWDFVHATLHPNAKSTVLYGESIGAPYAARVATQREACCVIAENSFPSLRRLANQLYGPIPMGIFAGESLLTSKWLNDAGIPVLVMHGKRDQVIPVSLGLELFNDLRVEKELFISETAGHSEIESYEGDRYFDTVVQFIQRHVTGH